MKRKLLSIVLCLALLFTTVFTGFTVASAEEATATENLLINGNFENYSGTAPANWKVRIAESASAEIVEDVEIAEGVTANAWKLTTTEAPSGEGNRNYMFYDGTIAIEKNAKYTMSYWVKITNNNGFRTYMYEPDYIAKDGTQKHNDMAQEGANIYTYTYDNGSTRVSRKDVKHFFKIAQTNAIIDGSNEGGPSMFISRSKGAEQPLTLDYPATERQGEWLQVVHTFETKNDNAHKADVTYQFTIPSAENGEVWIADLQMTVERFYAASVNDNTLGAVTPTKVRANLGDEITVTASPFSENDFLGWYDGDKLVSENPEMTVVFNGGATPDYTAHFKKNNNSFVQSFEEGFTNGQTLAQATAAIGSAADKDVYAEFANTEKDGSGIVIDSTHSGTWRKATITNKYVQSGNYSLQYYGAYGSVGYRYTGLEKNTNYTVSVYAYLTSKVGGTDWPGISNPIITPGNKSFLDAANKITSAWSREEWADVVNTWTKVEMNFNTGDNESIIFWIDSCGSDAYLYLDNFSISRGKFDYTPGVNDNTLGYVNTVQTRVGGRTTIVATTYGEATFDGWYNGDTLISKDANYTFYYTEEAANYEARFTAGSIAIDGGFENFENAKDLAVLQHVTGTVGQATSDWTPDLWKQSSKDGNGEYFMESNNSGNYRKIQVTNKYAHTGKQSIKFTGYYGFMGRKITGLEKNTDYIFSLYGLVKNSDTAKIGGFKVTTSEVAPVLPDGKNIDDNACIAHKNATFGVKDKWVKGSIKFNSGENTEVIVWVYHGNTADVYLDDFAITKTHNVEVAKSAYGTTDATGVKNYGYGENVTVTATPYAGNTFAGWYVGDELVSEDATYTFAVNDDVVLTPKYNGEVYNHLVANGQDGTFESLANDTKVEGIYFHDKQYESGWCHATVTTKGAYEGTQSVNLFGRHRNTIIPLTNLEKNSDYTISFYFYINETEAPAADGSGIVKKAQLAAGVTAASILDLTTENLSKVAYVISEERWQKVELTFNTGNNTDVNLVLRLTRETDKDQIGVLVDNLEVMYQRYVAPAYTPGNVDGDTDNNVNLNDLVTLAQYVAEWQGIEVDENATDINADGVTDLNDITTLARYLAGWEGVLIN